MQKENELVGIIVKNVQNIEIDLSYIVAYDIIFSEFKKRGGEMPTDVYEKVEAKAVGVMNAMSESTFGYAYEQALKTDCVNQKICDRIGKVLDDRNFVIHKMYRGDTSWMYENNENEKTIPPVVKYLTKVVNESQNLSRSLSKIRTNLEKEYNNIT